MTKLFKSLFPNLNVNKPILSLLGHFFPIFHNKVEKHKTMETHNAQHLAMDADLVRHLKVYVQDCRLKIPSTIQCPNLFITHAGQPMTSSAITTAVKKMGGSASCTKIRKMVSTTVWNTSIEYINCEIILFLSFVKRLRFDIIQPQVCQVLPQEKRPTANFMKHTEKTQSKYYDLSQSGVQAARQSRIVHKLVRGERVLRSDLLQAKACKYLRN